MFEYNEYEVKASKNLQAASLGHREKSDFAALSVLKVNAFFLIPLFRVNVWSTVKLSDVQRNCLITSTARSRSQFIDSIFKTRKRNLTSFDGLILLSNADFESGSGF